MRFLKTGLTSPEWNSKKHFTPQSGKPKELRNWQPLAFDAVRKSRFSLISAFCGSGKSILQVALSIDEIVSSGRKQKQLIVVPQGHIAANFTVDGINDYIPIKLHGRVYSWSIRNYAERLSSNVIQGLKDWLLADPKKLVKYETNQYVVGRGLAAVATHQAIGLVFSSKNSTAAERKRMIRNLTLRVDEAHHVKGVFDLTEEGLSADEMKQVEEEATNLGRIAGEIVNSPNEDSRLQLVTATFYRGDQAAILSPKVQDKFKTYYLDWLEHWRTLGLKKFNVEFEFYSKDPISRLVQNIKREPKEKHMIVVPATHNKWRRNGKEVANLLAELYKIYPAERVLDLVTKETQSANTERLQTEPRSAATPSNFDVIVTCMIGREGMDWVPCSRLHNTSPENSITLAVQTMGRVFRRYADASGAPIKTLANICNYIPEFAKPKRGMTMDDVLADRLNAVLFLMQVDEMVHPLIVPKLFSNRTNERGTPLSEVFGSSYQKMKEELFKRVDQLDKKEDSAVTAIINDILDDYEIKSRREDIADTMKVLIARATSEKVRAFGIDVRFLREQGFNQLVKKYDLDRKSIFFADCSHREFQRIRKMTEGDWYKMFRAYKKMVENDAKAA